MDIPGVQKKSKVKAVALAALFYGAWSLLALVMIGYGFFELRWFLADRQMHQVQQLAALTGTSQQKQDEQQVLADKQKIEDFAVLLSQHRISSNLFAFLEAETLPNVWFSNFSMSESTDEIRVLGETDTLESLSQQVSRLEQASDYVKDINVLDSQQEGNGKVSFTLDIYLTPKVFSYQAPAPAGPAALGASQTSSTAP